jgi:hypothetical protein
MADEDDRVFPEVAIAGRADFLVTGMRRSRVGDVCCAAAQHIVSTRPGRGTRLFKGIAPLSHRNVQHCQEAAFHARPSRTHTSVLQPSKSPAKSFISQNPIAGA